MIWFLSAIALVAAIVLSYFHITSTNKKRKKQLEEQQWNNQLADLLNSFKKKA